jgi:hypothetical protein
MAHPVPNASDLRRLVNQLSSSSQWLYYPEVAKNQQLIFPFGYVARNLLKLASAPKFRRRNPPFGASYLGRLRKNRREKADVAEW